MAKEKTAIINLPPREWRKMSLEGLQAMYDEYNHFKAYYNKDGHLVTPREIFLNKNKVLSYDKQYGWAHYDDGSANFDKLKQFIHFWDDYEVYQRNRNYAKRKELESYDLQNG